MHFRMTLTLDVVDDKGFSKEDLRVVQEFDPENGFGAGLMPTPHAVAFGMSLLQAKLSQALKHPRRRADESRTTRRG